MAKYTYDNIIINPTQKGIKSLIGKEVYFHNNPSLCLENANEKSTSNLGILVEISKNSIVPFRIEQKCGTCAHTCAHACIIEKKEEPKPEYVPFESIEEFVERYTEVKEGTEFGTFEDNLLQCGMWIKSKDDDDLSQVTVIREYGICIDTMSTFVSWKNLLDDFEFIDGSPCGKLMEESNA